MCEKILIDLDFQKEKVSQNASSEQSSIKIFSPKYFKINVHREEGMSKGSRVDELIFGERINYPELRDFVIDWLINNSIPIWLAKDIIEKLEFDIEHLEFSKHSSVGK